MCEFHERLFGLRGWIDQQPLNKCVFHISTELWFQHQLGISTYDYQARDKTSGADLIHLGWFHKLQSVGLHFTPNISNSRLLLNSKPSLDLSISACSFQGKLACETYSTFGSILTHPVRYSTSRSFARKLNCLSVFPI